MIKETLTAEQRILKIRKGKGLNYILEEAYKILGNPIFVFNMEYELLANSDGADNDDPICAEFMRNGKLGSQTTEFFKNEDFIDAVASCNGVVYLSSDKLKYDRVFGQLYNSKHLPVADLVIVASDKLFEEDIQPLVRTLCSVVSSELGKDKFYEEYGQSYQEGIVDLLADGKIENKGVYSGHVSNVDKDLKENIFLAVCNLPKESQTQSKLAYCRDTLKAACPVFKYFIHSNQIIILMSFNKKNLVVEKDLKKILPLLEEFYARIGISSCFENLFEMNTYYKQALCALKDGLKQKSDKHVFLYKN